MTQSSGHIRVLKTQAAAADGSGAADRMAMGLGLWRRLGSQLVCAVLAVMLLIQPAMAQRSISIIRDAETERMIRAYSNPIFQAAGLQPESVRIYLINDPTPNAFATVGRRMGLHTGLILTADTPNQIIGVIAHETGHIAGGHVARIDAAIASTTAPVLVTMALGVLAAVAGAPDAGIALLLGGQQIAQRQLLSYSRVQESSADQAAVTYLDSIGVSSVGVVEFFGKFRDQELLIPGRRDPYARTHPLSSDRIAALRGRLSESPYTNIKDTPEAVAELSLVKAKLYGFIDEPVVTFRRYPPNDTSKEAHYARTVAHFQQGSVDLAVKEIEPLLLAQPDNPYFHELHGQVLFESGRAADAIGPYREALALLPDEGLFHMMLGQALLSSDIGASEGVGDPEITAEALKHLKRAAFGDGENSFVWHQLAIAYARLGNRVMADLSTAERFYVGGNAIRAVEFAARARAKLPPGSPEWNRANDILQASEDTARRQREQLRRRRRLTVNGPQASDARFQSP